MTNVLVLGSSGQIGNYLCNHLTSKNYNVIKFDIVDGDSFDLRIHDNTKLIDAIKKSDFIFFLAFDVGGSRYLNIHQHTYDFINNNLLIMTNTFSLIKKYNKKFFFASSQMSNIIDSPYGILKNIGEYYTKSLQGKTIKFWNVYGIEHDYSKSHVITDFIIKAKTTSIIDMRTDGNESREFLYAEDCVECLELLMLNYESILPNEELHVSSFVQTKILDIANIIAKKFNASIIPSTNIDEIQKNKNNIPNDYIFKFWKPKTSIEDGIAKIITAME